jgi:Ala-tRNA(Pro) deacylase
MKCVEEFLKANNIEHVVHEHPAVFTCEEAQKHCSNVPGVASKNLFLRDDKKRRYFLVILSSKKRADLKNLAQLLGVKRVSFANDTELKEKLGLEPGAVSIFGLLNDKNLQVELFIDKDFYESSVVNFHPNRNTASVELKKEMLEKFLEIIEHKVNVINIS